MSANRHSFDKMSHSYAQNCALQNEVAKILVDFCASWVEQNARVLDLGAGSGNVARNLSRFLVRESRQISHFLALDSAPKMLSLHPRILPNVERIELLECDFEVFKCESFDLVLSSSALQWAKDLDGFARNLSKSSAKKFAFAIFTSESLCDLHAFLGTKSPLKSHDEIYEIFSKYFCVESKMQKFALDFPTSEAFLCYLKKCALLGGGNLNFAQKKRLKYDLPLKCAHFEVIFLKGKKK